MTRLIPGGIPVRPDFRGESQGKTWSCTPCRRKRSDILFGWLWMLVAPFLLAACLPEGVRVPESPLLRNLERKSGLIAYVGLDGNIYTIDQGGGQMTPITEDASLQSGGETRGYQFPIWSPDSRKLAFVGVSGSGGDTQKVSLYTASPQGDGLTEAYSSDTEFPFYLFWSPDSQQISFLTNAASGTSLVLQLVPAEGGDTRVLDTGQPYYWDWSPDSEKVLIHAGGFENGRLAFLLLEDEVIEEGLTLEPSTFQAPAWSPDGKQLLLAAETGENGRALVLADRRGTLQKTLASFSGSVAFAWSPDGRRVAYVASEELSTLGVLGPLTVLDPAGEVDSITTEHEGVYAFFWSPDGEKIVYFVPVLLPPSTEGGQTGQNTQSEGVQILLGVFVLNVQTGEPRRVTVIRPTQQFFNVLPYFDQYQRSVTIWSPDSTYLVLPGITPDGDSTIWVVASSGNLTPRLIAEGSLAFWSWK